MGHWHYMRAATKHQPRQRFSRLPRPVITVQASAERMLSAPSCTSEPSLLLTKRASF